MESHARPQGIGLYETIFLSASTRRTVLRETVRDRDHLPAQLDPQPLPTASEAQSALDRRLGNGYSPAEVQRINEADRESRADVRDVALAYWAMALTAPEGHS